MDELIKIPGRQDKKGFFPETTFSEIIHEKTVRKELKQYPQWFESDLVDPITAIVCGDKPLRKIFTLLVIINKLDYIKLFIDDGIFDESLPVSKVARADPEPTFQLSHNHTSQGSIRRLNCFSNWDAIDVWTFEEWQWTTLSPVLERGKRRNVKHLIVRDELSLPFTEDSRCTSGSYVIEGGFSTVFKAHIHPANHRFHGSEVGFRVTRSQKFANSC